MLEQIKKALSTCPNDGSIYLIKKLRFPLGNGVFSLFKFLEKFSYSVLGFVGAELVGSVCAAEKRVGDKVVLFFKYRYLTAFNERIWIDSVALNTGKKI